jgi:hypothetical protein
VPGGAAEGAAGVCSVPLSYEEGEDGKLCLPAVSAMANPPGR